MVEENTVSKNIRVCSKCGTDKTNLGGWYNAKRFEMSGMLCSMCYQQEARRLGIKKTERQYLELLSPDKRQEIIRRKDQTRITWYKSNIERALQRAREYKIKMAVQLMKVLDQYACVYCGCELFACLEFDHINGGGNKDRKMRGSHWAWKKYYIEHPEEARRELQVTCANCNRLKKWKDSGISNSLD